MSYEFGGEPFSKRLKNLLRKLNKHIQPIAKSKPSFNIYEYAIAKAEALQLTTGEMEFAGAVFTLMAHSSLDAHSLVKVLEHLVDVEKALRDEEGHSVE